jgi:hypothetical protein
VSCVSHAFFLFQLFAFFTAVLRTFQIMGPKCLCVSGSVYRLQGQTSGGTPSSLPERLSRGAHGDRKSDLFHWTTTIEVADTILNCLPNYVQNLSAA